MCDEDRRLQIKLAQLQTDIQIYLTSVFSIFGICMAIAFGSVQVSLSLPSDQSVQKLTSSIVAILSVALAAYSANYYIRKMRSARDEMESLESTYAW